MICFHKWKYVKSYFSDTFLREPIFRSYNRFRVCEKCGQAQEADWDGWSWNNLNDTEIKILKSKILNKGKYFELPKGMTDNDR